MNLRKIGSAAVFSLAAIVGAEGCGQKRLETPHPQKTVLGAIDDPGILVDPRLDFYGERKPPHLTAPETVDDFREAMTLCRHIAKRTRELIGDIETSGVPATCRTISAVNEARQKVVDVCSTLSSFSFNDPVIKKTQREISALVSGFRLELLDLGEKHSDCFSSSQLILSSADPL